VLAPSSYLFTLTAPDGIPLDARRLSDGSWEFFVVERDDPLFVLSAPTIADASGFQQGAPVTMAVVKTGREFAITLIVDPLWLHDTARQFPVILDPTVRIQPPAEDASFDAACGTCLPLLDKRLNIGTDTLHKWRSALSFDLGDVPKGSSLISANLDLYYQGICLPASGAPSCLQQTHRLDVHRITSTWTTSTPSSQLTYSPTILRSFTLPLNAGEQWMAFDVTTTVTDWLTGAQANRGLLVKRSDETLNRGGPRPPGRRYEAEPTLKPYLDVRWSSAGVDLKEPTTIHSDGAELSWTPYVGTGFQRYEVHRSPTPRFTPSPATLLATITNQSVTTYRDTTADPEATFTYKVVANTSPSNERTVTMPSESLTSQVLQPASEGKGSYLQFPDTANCINNGARDRLFVGSDSTSIYRSLLFFDLSTLPSGAFISEADVAVWNIIPPQASTTIDVHPLTTSWVEGTGNQTCTTDGVTWFRRAAGQSWTAPGGDYDASPTASFDRVPSTEPQWDEFEITGIVQEWTNGSRANNGLLLKATNETLGVGKNLAYASDDWWVSPTLRPKLTILYATEDLEAEGPDLTVDPNVPDAPDGPSDDPFDDPTHAVQVGTPDPPPAPPEGSVRVYINDIGVTFENDDGRWMFYFNCRFAGGDKPWTVGPGYIARFIDDGNRRVVDDKRSSKESPLAGGLGMYGWHHSRGAPENHPAGLNPVDFWNIEGRFCAADPDHANAGVYMSEVLGCPDPTNCQYIYGNVGVFDADVWFRDPYGNTGYGPSGHAITRVRYRWRIRWGLIRMWAAVTTYGVANQVGPAFAKEPKFIAGVARRPTKTTYGPDNPRFKRMALFGGNGRSFIAGKMRGCPPLADRCGSVHANRRGRVRVRWDYGTTLENPDGNCTGPDGPCFSVVMRAYPPTPVIDGTLNGTPVRWQAGGLGLDRWAWLSGCPPQSCPVRRRAYPVDTAQGPRDPMWDCLPGDPPDEPNANPRHRRVRRWEFVGRKPEDLPVHRDRNRNPYLMSATDFHGWEGGAGFPDCEPLMREFGPVGESWAVFASFGLGNKFALQ
jgi:hypothetical protein